MEKLTLTKQQELIGKQILKEIRARIRFLDGCWTGLSDTCKSDRYSFRRRGTANPSGNPDWFRTGRCGLYSG